MTRLALWYESPPIFPLFTLKNRYIVIIILFYLQVEGARLDKKTRIGMILGTGSNAAFLERADRVHHWEGERHNEKNVVIDIEWGAFGDKGSIDFIRTKYDREVDNVSLLKQSFT